MPVRRGPGRQTIVERVAEDIGAGGVDLRPYLKDGVEGLRRFTREISFKLQIEGGSPEDTAEVLNLLGVDVAECYRVMFARGLGQLPG
jgi:hypothetical protein